MYFKQEEDILLRAKLLKSVEQITYLNSNILSTESNINICRVKALNAIDWLLILWKFDLFDKIKQHKISPEYVMMVLRHMINSILHSFHGKFQIAFSFSVNLNSFEISVQSKYFLFTYESSNTYVISTMKLISFSIHNISSCLLFFPFPFLSFLLWFMLANFQ